MSIPYHLYDEETRRALLSAIEDSIEKGLDDEFLLAVAEEAGIELTGDTGLSRAGELSVKLRIPVVAAERGRKLGRLRQRLNQRGVCVAPDFA